MRLHLLAPAGMLVLALLVGVGAVQSHAGRNPRGGDSSGLNGVAVVDMERLYNESNAVEEIGAHATQVNAEAEVRLRLIESVPFLEVAELTEFGELAGKIAPTAEQKAKVEALRKLSEQRQQELHTLQSRKQEELTPADRVKLRDLSERERRHQLVVSGVGQDLRIQQAQRMEAFRSRQIQRIRGVVGQVAKEKGILHVFDTSALVYSANDLTTAVLAKLPRRGGKP